MKMIKFYADWCGPCKALSKTIDGAKDKIAIPIDEVDIDKETSVAMQYGIRSVPTLMLVDENGNILKRVSGTMNESQLLDFVKV